MIIARNKNQADNTRRSVAQAVEVLNTLLVDYSATGLPPIKTTADLRKFGAAPFKYWEQQVIKAAKEKGMEGADPGVFAALFNLEFKTKVKQGQAPVVAILEYIRIRDGEATEVEDLDKQLEGLGTVEVTDPEEEQVARELMKAYKEFTYWSTVLSGGTRQHIVARGTVSLGFSPMSPGRLNLEAVRRAVAGVQHLDKKKFTDMLVQQSGNQVWEEID